MSERQYRNGETIYRRGDTVDGAFRVRRGVVRLTRPGEVRIDREAGAVFGVAGVLNRGVRGEDAEAADDVTVDFLHADDVVLLLSPREDLMAGAISALFARQGAAEQPNSDDDDPGAEGTDPPGPAPVRIRLVPAGQRIRNLIGDEGIEIERLPYRIGRKAEDMQDGTYRDVDLTLEDSRPFRLSRRHVSIETRDGELVVRDCGSRNGTLVAGMDLGGDWGGRIAGLGEGETELIVGGPNSPFRFTIVVG